MRTHTKGYKLNFFFFYSTKTTLVYSFLLANENRLYETFYTQSD